MCRRREEILSSYPWLKDHKIQLQGQVGGRFAAGESQAGWWIDGATLEGVDFSGLDLAGMTAIGSRFIDCDFGKAKLKKNVNLGLAISALGGGLDERATVFTRCCFDGADLISPRGFATVLGAARFEHCTFRGTRISGWRTARAEFIGCHFDGLIRSCQFHGRDPDPVIPGHRPWTRQTNAFVDNDFRDAVLDGCTFAGGIDVQRQRWPDEGYLVVTDVSGTRARVARLIATLDGPARDTVRWIVSVLLPDPADTAQTTQLIRVADIEQNLEADAARALRQAFEPAPA